MVLHTARYQQVYKTPEVPVSTIDLEKALSLQKEMCIRDRCEGIGTRHAI